jgi:hypothetical protein
MTELVSVSYVEDNDVEQKLAELTKEKIENLGHLCIVSPTYYDAYGGDGPSPIVEFPNGSILEGISEVSYALEQDLLSNNFN